MPRQLLHPQKVSIDLGAPPRVTRLRSTPREEGPAMVVPQILRQQVAAVPPRQDLGRTRFGRALNLDRIEAALRSADFGSMRTLTDLSRETIDTDPHLAAVLGKRFGAVSALPWEIVPATGIGIDKEMAVFYADVVRDQLKQLANFSQAIHQLAWGLFDGRAALENEWLLTGMLPGLPVVSHTRFGTVRWMVRDLSWIHPRRLQFGPQRELRLNDTFDGGNFSAAGVALDELPLKFIQFTPQLFGDYQEREGLARRCLYWSFFKRSSARERMMLMELFGKPWRWLEVDEESTADTDDLEAADEMLQQLGGSASFRFPRGTKLHVEQPAKGAGEVHQQVIEESDKQLSKLVLGQTGTTDANPAGLNNVQANVMQDEQFMLLMRDARLISEVIETYLTDAIIELNFGNAAVTHAPHFVLRADVPLDRTKELGRLKAAVDAGLEVAVAEAYEISGFRQPRVDEPVIKIETAAPHPLAVQPPPERAQIVYPQGFNLPAREVQPIAPPAGGELPPPRPPSGGTGTPPAGGGGGAPAPDDNAPARDDAPSTLQRRNLSLELSRARSAAAAMESGNIAVTLANSHPSDAAAVRNTFLALAMQELGIPHVHLDGSEADDDDDEDIDPEEEVRKAMQPIERGELGSIETVILRGSREGARASEAMAKTFSKAVEGLTTSKEIAAALDRAAEDMDLQPFTRSIERRLLQGAMTGGLAAHFELLEDKDLPKLNLANSKSFTERPYNEAARWFQQQKVVNKNTFNRLDAASKRRSFTIANVHNQRQLEIAKEELKRALESGTQLSKFATQLNDRFALAGMTTLNPSHVETVYRTNVVNAYNSGRHAQMTQPAVLRARPYWRINTVNDGPPRQRATHQAVHNWVVRADDSIWATTFPPFGFNCRCRVASVSQADVDNKGLRVRSGGEIHGLPDPGFTAGVSALL